MVIGACLCIWLFVVYGKYHDAPCDEPLAEFCLITAVIGVVGYAITAFIMIRLRKIIVMAHRLGEDPDMQPITTYGCILVLLSLGNFIFYVIGNTWVWNSTNCSDSLRSSARIYLIISYVMVGFSCVIQCTRAYFERASMQ
jgi:amino acid transporter